MDGLVEGSALHRKASAGSRPIGARRPTLGERLRDATEALVDRPAVLLALFVLISLAARCVQFGNPVIQVDDEFYLLVGDRMLRGDLPFVDIWDRKPVGLFLIYAAIRMLGGSGVLEYQIVAALFVAATAFVIARGARQFTGAHGAAAAGVAYILYLGVFGGEGGQSPVFYNLPMAIAGLLTLGVVRRGVLDARAVGLGMAAMLLVGLALQIKYSVVFEGVFFGLALMWAARRDGAERATVAGLGVLWALVALAPTVAAWCYYAAIGHVAEFVQANFLSILERGSDGGWSALKRLGWLVLCLSPLGLAAWLSRPWGRKAGVAWHFVECWVIAAVVGVLLFGTFFDHYALPLLVPFAIAAAPVLGDRHAGLLVATSRMAWRMPAGVALLLLAGWISIPLINKNRRDRGWGPQVETIANYIRPRLDVRRDGCVYVYHGDPALYRLSGSCLPTRWPFPNHLNYTREAGALGVDPLTETARIMAGRPKFVVTSTRPERETNAQTWRLMQTELARHYAPVLSVPVGSRLRVLYQRRPG